MSSSPDDRGLIDTLAIAQRLGVTGERDLVDAIAHARGFVRCLAGVPAGANVVDLGSGGGLPGIAIAHDRPDLAVTLVERRRSRADLLVRMAGRITGMRTSPGRPVTVVSDDVAHMATPHGGFDAATARSFGSPSVTLSAAASVVRPGGLIVISDPPPGSADRWTPELLSRCGVERLDEGDDSIRVSCFRVL